MFQASLFLTVEEYNNNNNNPFKDLFCSRDCEELASSSAKQL